MFLVNAQSLKSKNNATTDLVTKPDDLCIDLNSKADCFGRDKYLFDAPVKVCRNTNVAFSPCDINGMNKVRCAFLGQFAERDDSTYKESSCTAKTRYEFDSQTEVELSLTKKRYFQEDDYIDQKIAETAYNSYDSLDKYVMMVDFDPSTDSVSMFDASVAQGAFSTHVYNILSDAGCIPHFAYQSLIRYSDRDGGTAYTWKNVYLDGRDHM